MKKKTIKKKDPVKPDSLCNRVKAAGWAYFLIIFSSIFFVIVIAGKYTVMGDSTATVAKMAENSLFVRLNIAFELIMFSAVIFLSVCLFEILKKVDSLLARTAMILRVGEAIMGYIAVLCSMAILVLIEKYGAANEMAVMFNDLRDIAYNILMICIGLGTIIFCWLFYRSRYIPRFLSIWGMGGFALITVAGLSKVLLIPGSPMLESIAALIVILFEFVIGLWLVIKGINVSK